MEEYRGDTLSDQRPTTLTSTRPGLASSATVWGHKKIGSADLVETFFPSFALPAPPEKALCSAPPSRSHSKAGNHREQVGSDSLTDCLQET